MKREPFRIGFTLVELLVSLAATSILLVGLGSTLFVVFRSSSVSNNAPATMEAATVVDDLLSELRLAESIIEWTARTVEFLVADRTGDDKPERIRYEWSGTAGDPLYRKYNGSAPAEVAASIQSFEIDYTTTRAAAPPSGPLESEELLLFDSYAPEDSQTHAVGGSNWVAQYFSPSLGVQVLQYKVTRVRLRAKYEGASSGRVRVEIRRTSGGMPTNTVLQATTMDEQSLTGKYAWREFKFDALQPENAGTGLSVVVRPMANTLAIQGRLTAGPQTNGTAVGSSSGGASWSTLTGQDLQMRIYGRGTLSVPIFLDHVRNLTDVQITLQQTPASQPVTAAVSMLNAPEVIGQ